MTASSACCDQAVALTVGRRASRSAARRGLIGSGVLLTIEVLRVGATRSEPSPKDPELLGARRSRLAILLASPRRRKTDVASVRPPPPSRDQPWHTPSAVFERVDWIAVLVLVLVLAVLDVVILSTGETRRTRLSSTLGLVPRASSALSAGCCRVFAGAAGGALCCWERPQRSFWPSLFWLALIRVRPRPVHNVHATRPTDWAPSSSQSSRHRCSRCAS